MPNNCLSVLYKHIIQVENKNVGLKVGGTNIPLRPNQNGGGGGGGAHALSSLYLYIMVTLSCNG